MRILKCKKEFWFCLQTRGNLPFLPETPEPFRACRSLIRKLKLYIFPAGHIVQKIQALPCMRRHHLKGIFFQTSSVAVVQCVCVLRPFAKVFLSHIWCKTSVDNDLPSCLSNIMELVVWFIWILIHVNLFLSICQRSSQSKKGSSFFSLLPPAPVKNCGSRQIGPRTFGLRTR